jgi:hypothetical protein
MEKCAGSFRFHYKHVLPYYTENCPSSELYDYSPVSHFNSPLIFNPAFTVDSANAWRNVENKTNRNKLE